MVNKQDFKQVREMIKETYEKEIADMYEEIEAQDKQILEKKQEIEKLREAEVQNIRLSETLEDTRLLLRQKEEEMETIQKTKNDVESQMKLELDEVRESLIVLKENQKLDNEAQEILKAEKKTIQDELQRAKDLIEHLENQSFQMLEEKEQLLEQKTSLENQFIQANLEVKELKSEIEALKTLNPNDSALEGKLESLRQAHEQLILEHEQLLKENERAFRDDFSGEITNYQTRIFDLEAKLEESEKELTDVRKVNLELKEEVRHTKDNYSSMSREDITEILFGAKIQAKKIVNKAETEAENIIADARTRLIFLESEGDKYYQKIYELANFNGEFLMNLKDKAQTLKKEG
ncbi:MAG: hypothetical protein LBV67_00125 [Streptococcaceae bacterium]|jgi:chromosome segregation ATPase|nr:hypothetical protein [Streptococcaceae bacterium]